MHHTKLNSVIKIALTKLAHLANQPKPATPFVKFSANSFFLTFSHEHIPTYTRPYSRRLVLRCFHSVEHASAVPLRQLDSCQKKGMLVWQTKRQVTKLHQPPLASSKTAEQERTRSPPQDRPSRKKALRRKSNILQSSTDTMSAGHDTPHRTE